MTLSNWPFSFKMYLLGLLNGLATDLCALPLLPVGLVDLLASCSVYGVSSIYDSLGFLVLGMGAPPE